MNDKNIKSEKWAKFMVPGTNIKGWVKIANLEIKALEAQPVQFNGQSCKVLGQTSTETLIDSPTEGPIWVNSNELLSSNKPISTPEAYPIEDKNVESSKVFLLSKSAGEIIK